MKYFFCLYVKSNNIKCYSILSWDFIQNFEIKTTFPLRGYHLPLENCGLILCISIVDDDYIHFFIWPYWNNKVNVPGYILSMWNFLIILWHFFPLIFFSSNWLKWFLTESKLCWGKTDLGRRKCCFFMENVCWRFFALKKVL